MVRKLNIKSVVISCSWVIIFLYIITHIVLNKFFIDKNKNIIKSTAMSILDAELKLEKILENASMVFEYYLEKNPNPSMEDLKNFCPKLNVDNCGIQDENGVVIVSSRHNAKDYQNRLYYQKHSIKDQIKNFDEMKKLDFKVLPSSFYGTEGTKLKSDQIKIVKGVDRWVKKMNKILYLKIRSDKIVNIMQNVVSAHKDIIDISFITPSGKVIASLNGNNYNLKLDEIKDYREKVTFQDSNNEMIYKISFGGLQNELWTHKSEIERGLTNKSGQYFYTIKVTFSKNELAKQLKIVKLMFFVSWILLLLTLYGISYQENFYQKVELDS